MSTFMQTLNVCLDEIIELENKRLNTQAHHERRMTGDAWLEIARKKLGKQIPLNPDDIPSSQHRAYIYAIDNMLRNGNVTTHGEYRLMFPFVLHVYSSVTTLEFGDVSQHINNVLMHTLFSPLICPEVYDFCDHKKGCTSEWCSCEYTAQDISKTIVRYIAYQNNLKIHDLWNVWDDDASLSAWLPHEIIADIVQLSGNAGYDNTHRLIFT